MQYEYVNQQYLQDQWNSNLWLLGFLIIVGLIFWLLKDGQDEYSTKGKKD